MAYDVSPMLNFVEIMINGDRSRKIGKKYLVEILLKVFSK
jgi:hypothetical protein